jgi:hypothetical protein
MIILDSDDARAWKALENVIPEDIFAAVHVTLTQSNQDEILLLERLAGMDLKAISLTTSDPRLEDVLQSSRAIAAGLGFTQSGTCLFPILH